MDEAKKQLQSSCWSARAIGYQTSELTGTYVTTINPNTALFAALTSHGDCAPPAPVLFMA